MKLAEKYVDSQGQVMYIKGKTSPSRLSAECMKEALGCKKVVMEGGRTFIAPFKAISEENEENEENEESE